MIRRLRAHPSAGWLAWIASLAGFLTVNLLWELLDQSPAGWDAAYHQLQGWRLLEAARQGMLWDNLPALSPAYPPLYYLLEAAILGTLGDTQLLAWIANLPGFVMISGVTYLFLRGRVAAPWLAGALCCLPLLFPSLAWVSRESLLDINLAGFVSLACLLILHSRGFTRLLPTLCFGLACLGGVLTKWTLPLYLAGPMVFGLFFLSRNRLLSLRNLCLAGLLIFPVSLIYFGPLLADLAGRYPTTEQTGLIPWKPYPRHGEPGLNNIWGWIYYPRVIAGYFLQFPLLIFPALAGFSRFRSTAGDEARAQDSLETGEESRQVLRLCAWWLACGMFLLTFLTPKDPRFFLPLVCPLAVLLVWPWRSRVRALVTLLGVAVIQFLLVSFPNPLGPIRLASWVWNDEADYQSLQHEWVWFQTHYFDAAGPPEFSDWYLDEILDQIEPGSTVAFLPELVRFNPDAILLQSVRRKAPIQVVRLGNDPAWEQRLPAIDYLIGKTGNQGISFFTGTNPPILERVRDDWEQVQQWPLPDGSQALLWQRK